MPRRVQFKVLVPVTLLAIAAALVVLAMLPERWWRAPPEPPRPLGMELIAVDRTGRAKPTSGMSVGRDGFGTILTAPARQLAPARKEPAAQEPMLTAAPPVPAEVAGLVRVLARLTPELPSDELVMRTLDVPPRGFGTIVLRDGCLRLAGPGEPHVVLPSFAKLYVDKEGFLSIGTPASGSEMNPRVGEPAWWEGDSRWPLDATMVARIRAVCGPGPAKQIGFAQSVAASQAAADGAAARNIVNRYGLPWTDAIAAARSCRKRLVENSSSGMDPLKMIENLCGSTPPSPVSDPRSCQSGTIFGGGLCRTPAGYIRPIPNFRRH